MENFQIPRSSVTSSSHFSKHNGYRARLGYYRKEMWCAYKRDLGSYLQVVLRIIGYVHTILDSYCTSRKKYRIGLLFTVISARFL